MPLPLMVPALVASFGSGLPAEAKKAFDRAYEALRAGRLEEALASYAKAVELAPDSWDIWLEYTSALRQSGQLQRAARAGWRTVELEPTRYNGWVNLANVFLQGQSFDAAWEALNEVARVAPKEPLVVKGFTNLGYQAWCAGQPALAERALVRALELAPDHALARMDLSAVRLSAGKAESRADLEACLRQAREKGEKQLITYGEDLLRRADQAGGLKASSPATWQWEELPPAFRVRPAKGAALALAPEPSPVRVVRFPQGRFTFRAPATWRLSAPSSLPAKGGPTLTFRPAEGKAWEVMLTIFPPREGVPLLDEALAKKFVSKGFEGQAVTIQWLPEPRGAMGWARDPSWKPGKSQDWPHALNAALAVGGSWFLASVLWEEQPTTPPAFVGDLLASLAWEGPR